MFQNEMSWRCFGFGFLGVLQELCFRVPKLCVGAVDHMVSADQFVYGGGHGVALVVQGAKQGSHQATWSWLMDILRRSSAAKATFLQPCQGL